MRAIFSITLLFTLTALAAGSDTVTGKHIDVKTPHVFREELRRYMQEKKAAQFNLGQTRKGRPIEAWFFPGTSEERALVIGGVHGSELSSIEVVSAVLAKMSKGESIYYNVIIIPSLFPDNAETAKLFPHEIGSEKNIGRYSFPGAPDPNRQMPTPGNFMDEENHTDHAGRSMDPENVLLLQLIHEFAPNRIASVHAIRNSSYAGFFADPRTDEKSIAVGYDPDSSLAMSMALHVKQQGGSAPGNFQKGQNTTRYYKDPAPAAKGDFQPRNFKGSPQAGQKPGGITLGTWASTAVKTADSIFTRDAIQIITIEFPGSKRPEDYTNFRMRQSCSKEINLYATAIVEVFLKKENAD